MQKKKIACLLAIALCVTSFVGYVHKPIYATNQEQKLKEEKSNLESQLDNVKKEVSQLKQQSQNYANQLSELKTKGKALQSEYEKLIAEMKAATAQMELAVKQSEEAIENVKVQQNAYNDRLSTLFRYRNRSTLEVLLASKNIEGFFTNMRMLKYIAAADNQLLENLKTAKEDAKAKQKHAEEVVAEYQKYMKLKETQLDNLKKGISLTQQKISEANKKITEKSKTANELVDEIEKNDAKLEAYYAEQKRLREEAERKAREEAERARREAEKNNGKSSSGSSSSSSSSVSVPKGKLLRPLAHYLYISSPYGPRVHPITGQRNGFHYGVDFAASFGTPIRAAKAGRVVIADKRYQGQNYTSRKSGYGNYVTIDHGDGTSTTYAHMRYVATSVGAYVHAGDYIGQVGSTGASTGAHLHFEYAIHGQTTDPVPHIAS